MGFHVDPPETTLTIGETDQGFAYWLGRDFLSKSVVQEAQEASILIAPQQALAIEDRIVFPAHTDDLVAFLDGKLPADISVAVLLGNDGYQELHQHFDVVVLGTIMVSAIVFPILADLLGEYVKRKIWPSDKDAQVKVTVIVSDKIVEDGIKLTYEGNALELSGKLKEEGEAPIQEYLKRQIPNKDL